MAVRKVKSHGDVGGRLNFSVTGGYMVCESVWKNGVVGQKVVVDYVGWGQTSETGGEPITGYPLKTRFTIIEVIQKNEHANNYRLRDEEGDEFVIDSRHTGYLYDIEDWYEFHLAKKDDELKRKKRRLRLVESHLDLLKGILTAQGIRIVTAEQAEALGIKP